ncbi:helix-turn-helix domain-containing protein [Brevibacillus reuszeri]|uniref:helix-turn-helix domain-containing protein n=1 Tax=Brevibacillus reuszeri TaxID=54915 RepID=UPI00366ECF0E
MTKKEQSQNKVHSTTTSMSLDEVRAYMAGHFAKAMSIHDLAQLTGLSPNYFGEAFKKAYGHSVMDFLTELRIGHAKKLLRNSDLYMHEVARKVGYTDEFYFSRKFKKAVGISPSAYRRDARKRVAVTSSADIGNLLALGVVPVAAPLDPKWSPYYHYYYQDLIKVHIGSSGPDMDREEESFRQLIAAKPDFLIVQNDHDDRIRDRFMTSGIECVSMGATKWQEQLRRIAEVLDKQELCEHWIDVYESRTVQARESISHAVGEDLFITLRITGEQIFLYSNRGIRDVLYRDLALQTIPELTKQCNEPITLEQLLCINPDRMLLLICPDADTRKFWLSLQYHTQWRGLNAIKNGQMHVIPSNPWFEYSAIAINRMLEETSLMLTGKNPAPSPVPVHGVTRGMPL